MQGLMLSTKDSKFVTRDEAFRTDIIPVRTKTYTPVKNSELIEMLHKAAGEHNLKLTNERLGMANKSAQLFGVYDIEGHNFFGDRVKMMLGLMNSYDKTLRARICLGQSIFCCSNLSFTAFAGENGVSSSIGHKHTSHILEDSGLWYRLNKSLDQVNEFQKKQEYFCSKLSDRELSRDEAYSTIVRSAQEGVLNKTKILDVASRWIEQERYPENEEEYENWHKEEQERTAFNLFNAFTEIRKTDKNIVTSNIKSISLTEFFNKEFVLN